MQPRARTGSRKGFGWWEKPDGKRDKRTAAVRQAGKNNQYR